MPIKVGNTYSPDAVYGISPGFSIADLASQTGRSVTTVLNAVVADTTSAAFALGANSVVLTVDCPTNAAQTFDITFYTVITGVDTVLVKYVGLKHGDQRYIGNFENLNIGYNPIKVRVDNRSSTEAITATVKITS